MYIKKNNFVTIIGERSIKVNFSLSFRKAVCLLRDYNYCLDNFFDKQTRKEIRVTFSELNELNNSVRKFLNRYYW